MRFRVHHRTRYRYSEPVSLGPHVLRLRPRTDASSRLLAHSLTIDPPPAQRSCALDSDGNVVLQVRFATPTSALTVTSRFRVQTDCESAPPPQGSLLSEAPYAPAERARLAAWIDVDDGRGAGVAALADEIASRHSEPAAFVAELNARLHASVGRGIREFGAPQSPEDTLRLNQGACRDLAVLFAATCRQVGLAARFVSGYQRGLDAVTNGPRTKRWMHAWPEVFLPGCGWLGYDPTHGSTVTDAHVALAAAADPANAAPITGSYFGAAKAKMTTDLRIHVDD